jgi:hypothetical protein
MIAESNPELLRTEFGKRVHELVQGGEQIEAYSLWKEHMAKRDDRIGLWRGGRDSNPAYTLLTL